MMERNNKVIIKVAGEGICNQAKLKFNQKCQKAEAVPLITSCEVASLLFFPPAIARVPMRRQTLDVTKLTS
jgi:hypothetical protein